MIISSCIDIVKCEKAHQQNYFLFDKKTSTIIKLKGHRTLISKLYCATPKLKLCSFFSEILNKFLENTCTLYKN